MNNSYLKYYRDKIRRKGSSSYERNYKLKEREFDDYFRNALTKEQCLVDGVSEYMIFQDHSQSNNKDLSDDKYIVCPNSVKVVLALISVGEIVYGWCSPKSLKPYLPTNN